MQPKLVTFVIMTYAKVLIKNDICNRLTKKNFINMEKTYQPEPRFISQQIALKRYGYKDYRALRRIALSGQIRYRVFVTPKGYEKWQFEA